MRSRIFFFSPPQGEEKGFLGGSTTFQTSRYGSPYAKKRQLKSARAPAGTYLDILSHSKLARLPTGAEEAPLNSPLKTHPAR